MGSAHQINADAPPRPTPPSPVPDTGVNASDATDETGGRVSPDIIKKILKRKPNIHVHSYTQTVRDQVDNGEAPPNERIGRMREDGYITRKIGNNTYIARRSDVDAEAGAHDHVAHGFGDPNVATIDSWDEWFYRNGALYKVGDKYASDLARTAAARLAKLNMAIARGLQPKTIEKLEKEAHSVAKKLINARVETILASNRQVPPTDPATRSVSNEITFGVNKRLTFARQEAIQREQEAARRVPLAVL